MIDEELERWRKTMSPEEFKSKFPEYAMKIAIDEAIEHLKPNTPEDIGPVGGGLYHIGGGVYTGKDGWDQFETELKKKINE